jgi:hypothetical protein
MVDTNTSSLRRLKNECIKARTYLTLYKRSNSRRKYYLARSQRELISRVASVCIEMGGISEHSCVLQNVYDSCLSRDKYVKMSLRLKGELAFSSIVSFLSSTSHSMQLLQMLENQARKAFVQRDRADNEMTIIMISNLNMNPKDHTLKNKVENTLKEKHIKRWLCHDHCNSTNNVVSVSVVVEDEEYEEAKDALDQFGKRVHMECTKSLMFVEEVSLNMSDQ